jgi:hypothetical protein
MIVALVTEGTLRALDALVISPLRAERGVATAWTGWARAAEHLADAVWLAGVAALPAAALVVFAGRRPWPVIAAWAAFVATLVVVHPRGATGELAMWLGAAQGLAVVASLGMFFTWRRTRTAAATPAHFVLTAAIANELVAVLTGWWARPPESWNVTQVLTFVVLGATILIQGRFLWSTRPSRSSLA